MNSPANSPLNPSSWLDDESIYGTNTLLFGPAGTGKTHAIGTLVDTGIKVFYLDIDNSLESLKGYWMDRNKPIPDNLHWHRIAPPKTGFVELMEMADKTLKLSYESLTKSVDPKRTQYDQFYKFLSVMADFKCQRTGQSFGAVDDWKADRVLVVDSLSGLSTAAKQMVVGGRPTLGLSDWGVAQNNLENFLNQLTQNCACHTVVIGHAERETDQVLGGVKISVSTPGRALTAKVPRLFSDVVLTVKDGAQWYWDTANTQADVKIRNLPVGAKLKPDFAQIINKWCARNNVPLFS